MRASRIVSLTALVSLAATLALGCSSSSSDGGAGPGTSDTGGAVDSSVTTDTGSVIDTGATPDSKKTDSGTASDVKTDGGGGSCDPHPGDECNMVAQDCPDPKNTCDYDPTVKHTACVANPIGPAAKGEACDSKTACDRGLFCYSGKCSPACCTGDNSVCGPGGQCKLAITDAAGDSGTPDVIYHACSYDPICHPFKYDCPKGDVCLFAENPDVFNCATPTSKAVYSSAPGSKCVYANDCGESQACFALTPDAGPSDYKCYMFCYLHGAEAGSVGTTPDGRFAADGTCTVGGKSYGTCTAYGFGSDLGLCVP